MRKSKVFFCSFDLVLSLGPKSLYLRPTAVRELITSRALCSFIDEPRVNDVASWFETRIVAKSTQATYTCLRDALLTMRV